MKLNLKKSRKNHNKNCKFPVGIAIADSPWNAYVWWAIRYNQADSQSINQSMQPARRDQYNVFCFLSAAFRTVQEWKC